MFLKRFFLSERTIILILTDILVIYGVLFLDFNVARMYGFYYVDFSIFLISYAIYNLITIKNLDISNVFWAVVLMLFIIGIFITAAMNFVLPIQIETIQDAANVFSPYYDLPIFAFLVIRADYIMVKGYLQFDNDLAKSEFSKLLLYNIFLIPTLIFVALLAPYIHMSIKLSLVLALVILRNITQYQSLKSFMVMEEINNTKSIKD